jgi:hypothetical protein
MFGCGSLIKMMMILARQQAPCLLIGRRPLTLMFRPEDPKPLRVSARQAVF